MLSEHMTSISFAPLSMPTSKSSESASTKSIGHHGAVPSTTTTRKNISVISPARRNQEERMINSKETKQKVSTSSPVGNHAKTTKSSLLLDAQLSPSSSASSSTFSFVKRKTPTSIEHHAAVPCTTTTRKNVSMLSPSRRNQEERRINTKELKQKVSTSTSVRNHANSAKSNLLFDVRLSPPSSTPTSRQQNHQKERQHNQQQQNYEQVSSSPTNSSISQIKSHQYQHDNPHCEKNKSATLLQFPISKQQTNILREHRRRMKQKKEIWQQQNNMMNDNHNSWDNDDNDTITSTCSSTTAASCSSTKSTTTATEVFDPVECMIRFQKQASESIHHVYEMEHVLRRKTRIGAVTTSLAEDLITLLHTFVNVLDTVFLTSHPMNYEISNDGSSGSLSINANCCCFINGLLFVIRTIRHVHCLKRYQLLLSKNDCSLEDICSTSNDFFRISEMMESFLTNTLFKNYLFLLQEDGNDIPTSTIPVVNQYDSSSEVSSVSPTVSVSHSKCQEINDIDQLRESLVSEWNEFSSLILQDSVYAAERCQSFSIIYILHNTTISNDLFSSRWENEWISNDVIIITLINVINEHMNQIRYFLLNDFLYNKAFIAYVKSIVCFYIRNLIHIANDMTIKHPRMHFSNIGLAMQHRDLESNNNERYLPFQNKRRSLLRMKEDISTLQQFFRDKTKCLTKTSNDDDNVKFHTEKMKDTASSSATLVRIISNELWILEVIHECLSATAEANPTKKTSNHDIVDNSTDDLLSSLESFIVVLHKRTGGNALVTRLLVSDLWLLAGGNNTNQRNAILNALNQIEPDLKMVTNSMNNNNQISSHSATTQKKVNNKNKSIPLVLTVPYVNLNEMLKVFYEDRMAQSSFWSSCLLPKNNMMSALENMNDNEDYNENDIDVRMARQIQKITRTISQLPNQIMKIPGKTMEHF